MAAIWHGGVLSLDRANAYNQGCLNERLGIEFLEAGPDWLRARMPVDERTRQPLGVLHGGASVAFAEALASWAGFSTLDPQRQHCVGMEINANHLRPVGEGWVYGVAQAEALGRTTQVWTIRITNEAGKLVCISRMTLAIIDKPSPR